MAVTATASGIVAGNTVHLSFGDVPAEEYAHQLAADHMIHGWDLAVATGGDTSMDPELVEALAAWFAGNEDGLPQRRRHRRAPRGGRDARRRVERAVAGLRARPGLASGVAPAAPGPTGPRPAGTRASATSVITAAKATTTARLSAAIAVAFDMPQMSWRPDELPPSSP